jgi:hypothetical protein
MFSFDFYSIKYIDHDAKWIQTGFLCVSHITITINNGDICLYVRIARPDAALFSVLGSIFLKHRVENQCLERSRTASLSTNDKTALRQDSKQHNNDNTRK